MRSGRILILILPVSAATPPTALMRRGADKGAPNDVVQPLTIATQLRTRIEFIHLSTVVSPLTVTSIESLFH